MSNGTSRKLLNFSNNVPNTKVWVIIEGTKYACYKDAMNCYKDAMS